MKNLLLLSVLALISVSSAIASTPAKPPQDASFDQTMVNEYFAGGTASHLKHNKAILPYLRTIRLVLEVPKGVSEQEKSRVRAQVVKQLADGGITVATKAPYVMHLAPGLVAKSVENGPGIQRYIDKATFIVVQREVPGEPKPIVFSIPGSSMHYMEFDTLVDKYCDWVKDSDYR